MLTTAPAVRKHAARLRRYHAGTLACASQAEVVDGIARWAARWQDPAFPFRRRLEALADPFPWPMARPSLHALLDSLTPGALWQLIDSEGARDARGPVLVGHVVAANTPLLSWVSALRALLVRSASLVKMPSGAAGAWGELFLQSWQEACPSLAESVHLLRWPGGSAELETAFCAACDCVLAYGSDATIGSLRAVCPSSTRLIGYGHRVSFGLLLPDADWESAARGFADDVLIYDQGGCLSLQTVFVAGDADTAREFAACLARALAEACERWPAPPRSPAAQASVLGARLLARMTPQTPLWEGGALRWTVIARPDTPFTLPIGHGVVSVQPLGALASLPAALRPLAGKWQGCAVAGHANASLLAALREQGLSRVCPPGQLQCPPLGWPQDGRPVLASLLGGHALTKR